MYQQMFRIKYIVPLLYCLLILVVYAIEKVDPSIIETYAVLPQHPDHLIGIVTAVFIHGGMEHLSSNILPLAICLFGLFHFYSEIALKVTLLAHVFSGALVWIFARHVYHVGASGLIYALIFFVLISALIKRNKQLTVFAFIVLVFQGGLMWGLVPQNNGISWESHLLGAITGCILAVVFRHQGPPPDMVIHLDDDEDVDEYLNL